VIKDAIGAASSSSRPIRVVDGDELVGVVDRVDLLSFLSGQDAVATA
jgi:glycine betaine/proline transport system ATP-binding protein